MQVVDMRALDQTVPFDMTKHHNQPPLGSISLSLLLAPWVPHDHRSPLHTVAIGNDAFYPETRTRSEKTTVSPPEQGFQVL